LELFPNGDLTEVGEKGIPSFFDLQRGIIANEY
jgi:hypothetical protein